jgi:hypothetical protein
MISPNLVIINEKAKVVSRSAVQFSSGFLYKSVLHNGKNKIFLSSEICLFILLFNRIRCLPINLPLSIHHPLISGANKCSNSLKKEVTINWAAGGGSNRIESTLPRVKI